MQSPINCQLAESTRTVATCVKKIWQLADLPAGRSHLATHLPADGMVYYISDKSVYQISGKALNLDTFESQSEQ
jgi:hypothetical protein